MHSPQFDSVTFAAFAQAFDEVVRRLFTGRPIVLVGVSEHSVTPIRTYTEDEVFTCGIELPEEDAPDYTPAGKPSVRVLETLRRITVRS